MNLNLSTHLAHARADTGSTDQRPRGSVGCGVTIRFASSADDPVLRRLAQLDSSPVPSPPMLIAEQGGEIRAALSLLSSQVIADPFHLTAEHIELLRTRAAQVSTRRKARARRRTAVAVRATRQRRFGSAIAASVIGVALYASATPSPLYALYQASWHFSTPVLTLVYATYALAVLASLLLVGGISDQTGRRPVLAWSLLGLLISLGLFLAASSVAWLLVARAVQGLATGAALGAAGAALIDLHPSGDPRHAAFVNGAVSLTGLGAGAFVSSLLVQFLPGPRVTPYILAAALLALLFAVLAGLPETVRERRQPSVRPRPPGVPAAIRGPFGLAALGALSSWSIAGFYLALGPEVAGHLLHTRGALAGGVAAGALMGSGALSQLAGRELSNRTLTAAGAISLASGTALAAAAVALALAALFFLASALAGAGFGLAFMGALRHLTAAIPAERRGEVMAAFYVVGYLSLSLPAIAAGLAANAIGLASTFETFGAAAALLAVAVAAGGLRIQEVSLRDPTAGALGADGDPALGCNREAA